MRATSAARLRVLVALVFVGGAGLQVWSWSSLASRPHGLAIALAFVAAAAVTEFLPARMRSDVTVTLLSVVLLTAVLYRGTALAVCAALGVALVSWRNYSDGRLEKTLFNFGQIAISAYTAGQVFAVVGGRPQHPAEIGVWMALLGAAVAFTLVNHALVAVAIRLSVGERVLSTLASVVGTSLVLEILYAGLSIIAAAVLVGIGPEALLFLVIPALVARFGLLGFAAEERDYDRLVSSLMKAIEVKDGYTRGHGDRVATLCVEVARELGYGYDDLRAVRYASMLHDVGKLNVPLEVLNKPGSLTDAEFAMIRTHPLSGSDIVEGIEFLSPALAGIRYHHERLDGRGYPYGLAGDGLPMVARIVTACDAFDAMTSTRSYRFALSVETAVEELVRCSGTQFDPDVVAILARVVERLDWQPTVAPYLADDAIHHCDHGHPLATAAHPHGHDHAHGHDHGPRPPDRVSA